MVEPRSPPKKHPNFRQTRRVLGQAEHLVLKFYGHWPEELNMKKAIFFIIGAFLAMGCQSKPKAIPHDWGDIYSACRNEASADYCKRRLGRDH